MSIVPHGGSVYTTQPSSTPKYMRSGNKDRIQTMARLGVSNADDPRQYFSGNFEVYKEAIAGNGYIDFWLTSVNESFTEKTQISEVLGDSYTTYTFGQHAPVFSFGGMLLNSKEDKWRAGMHYLYHELLRASAMARRGLIARIQYDTTLIEGVLLTLNTSLSGGVEVLSPFNFTMLVKSMVELDPSTASSVSVATPFGALVVDSLVSEADEEQLNETVIEVQSQDVVDAFESGDADATVGLSAVDLLNDGWA